MTPNEACNAIVDAVFTWSSFMHGDELDWDGARRALEDAISSPFVMRDDSETHLQYMRNPVNGNVMCRYRTKKALDLSYLLRSAARLEDLERFKEHFYTALEL